MNWFDVVPQALNEIHLGSAEMLGLEDVFEQDTDTSDFHWRDVGDDMAPMPTDSDYSLCQSEYLTYDHEKAVEMLKDDDTLFWESLEQDSIRCEGYDESIPEIDEYMRWVNINSRRILVMAEAHRIEFACWLKQIIAERMPIYIMEQALKQAEIEEFQEARQREWEAQQQRKADYRQQLITKGYIRPVVAVIATTSTNQQPINQTVDKEKSQWLQK